MSEFTYEELKAQRDELLSALMVAEKYLRPRVENSGTEGRTVVLPAIRTAIAKATGQIGGSK